MDVQTWKIKKTYYSKQNLKQKIYTLAVHSLYIMKMYKTIAIITLVLLMAISITPVAAENTEYIVKGEENLEDNYNIKEEYKLNNHNYYVVTLNGTGTLSLGDNVQKNHKIKAHKNVNSSQQLNYNLDIIEAHRVPPKSEYEDINIAVLDTGISSEHDNINSVEWERSLVTSSADDKNGHGTHVAGIISASFNNTSNVRGVAPGVSIYNVKVLDNNGFGELDDVAQGIKIAARGPDGIEGTQDDADIISMSLGGNSGFMMNDAVDAVTPETIVVASAGNGENIDYPAKFENTISVASVSESKEPAFFSASGKENDLAAPGNSVKSTSKNGGFVKKSGTSMAAPHVSGSLALVLSQANIDSGQAESILESSTEDVHKEGFDKATGHGLLNVRKLLNTDVPPSVEEIRPDRETLLLGERILFDTSTFGKEASFYYSIKTKNQTTRYKQVQEPVFHVTQSDLNRTNYPVETIVSVKVKTSAGTSTLNKSYTIVNEREPDITVTEFRTSKEVAQPYSPIPIRTKIKNSGLKEGKYKGKIMVGEEVQKKIEVTIPPGKSKRIMNTVVAPGPSRNEMALPITLWSTYPQQGEKTQRVQFEKNEAPISLKSFKIKDNNPQVGEDVPLKIKVKNNVNDKVELSGEVNIENYKRRFGAVLKPHQSQNITMDVSFNKKGQREVLLDSNMLGDSRMLRVNVSERTPKKNFTVTDISFNDSIIRTGENIKININVRNENDKTETFSGEVSVSQGNKKTVKSSINGEQEKVIKTNMTIDKSGELIVFVKSESGQVLKTSTIRVFPRLKSDMSLNKFSVVPNGNENDIIRGEPVIAKASVSNEENRTGIFVGIVKTGSDSEHVMIERIEPNTTKTVSTNIKLNSLGNQVVELNSDSGRKKTLVKVVPKKEYEPINQKP